MQLQNKIIYKNTKFQDSSCICLCFIEKLNLFFFCVFLKTCIFVYFSVPRALKLCVYGSYCLQIFRDNLSCKYLQSYVSFFKFYAEILCL